MKKNQKSHFHRLKKTALKGVVLLAATLSISHSQAGLSGWIQKKFLACCTVDSDTAKSGTNNLIVPRSAYPENTRITFYSSRTSSDPIATAGLYTESRPNTVTLQIAGQEDTQLTLYLLDHYYYLTPHEESGLNVDSTEYLSESTNQLINYLRSTQLLIGQWH